MTPRDKSPKTVLLCVSGNENAEFPHLVRAVTQEQGATVVEAHGSRALVEELRLHPMSPVLVECAGFESASTTLLETIRGVAVNAPVIVVLERHSVSDAVRFIRYGAFECLGPESTADELSSAIEGAFDQLAERQARQVSVAGQPWRALLVGRSPAMEQVATVIRMVAPRRCSVLISGETGTGKEVAARSIHMASDRARKPMVSVNCSALPENLIEAELFGHVKGAFTGAANSRMGRFEQANGGTLFLDEIGDLPYDLQAKLLRVLQERELQRLGASETIKVDVRVIAATNANLPARIQQGQFREDLYYRLNVVPLRMPALRERAVDIPLLVDHFVRKVCQSEGLAGKRVSSSALDKACACSWPGNVRQLENVVEQAIVMGAELDTLEYTDFNFPHTDRPVPVASTPITSLPEEGIDFTEAVRKFERTLLDQALAKAQGNKTLAADMLRLPRTTLIHKLRSYGAQLPAEDIVSVRDLLNVRPKSSAA